MAIKAVEERRAERERLIELARTYAETLAHRIDLETAVVAGSVARGDFNVWSDIDVVVIASDLPQRAPDRAGVLLAEAPVRIQPVGFTPDELHRERQRGNRLVEEAASRGVVVYGSPL